MNALWSGLAAGCLILAVVPMAYTFLLALAARLPARNPGEWQEAREVAVLVPAHNEEATVGRLLDDLHRQGRPPACVLVVADGCSDRTATVAREHGAAVLELPAPAAGKPRALQAGIQHLERIPWDTLLVVDADCRVSPDFLARARSGRGVVSQASVVLQGQAEGAAYDYASRLENRVFHAGRARLGFTAFLRGTGMFLGRDALERRPWAATGLTEDRAQGLAFLRAGVPVLYAGDAEVLSGVPANWGDAWTQRRRWSSENPLAAVGKAAALLPHALRAGGSRAVELPLAVWTDARSAWLGCLALAWILDIAAGGAWRTALVWVTVAGLVAGAACGVAWYGRRFPRLVLELPSALILGVSASVLALMGKRPGKWERGRRDA